MNAWYTGAWGVAAGVCAAALHASRFMDVWGVNPNLVLVLVILGSYLTGRMMWGIGAAAGAVAAAFVWFPAFGESAIAGACAALVASYALMQVKGGRGAAVGAIAGGTALFYLAGAVFQGTRIAPGVIAGEIFYNALWGIGALITLPHHARRITS